MFKNVFAAAKANTIKYIEKKAAVLRPEDVNIKDVRGNTPLYYACARGHTEVAKILIRIKADVNCRNEGGNTPLHAACKLNNLEANRCFS